MHQWICSGQRKEHEGSQKTLMNLHKTEYKLDKETSKIQSFNINTNNKFLETNIAFH